MFETLIKEQVQGIMRILGQDDGLAPFGTYIDVDRTGTSYSVATGRVTIASTSYTGVPMVLSKYSSDEVDGSKIVMNDQKAIIASLDLPVTPSVSDKIVAGGRTFMVIHVGGVPGNSVWILQIRETE